MPTPPCTWLHARWRNAPAGSPLEMFSELDHARWETRKVEVFAGDRWHWAGPGGSSHGDTQLSDVPIPPLAEIVRDLQFEAREISADEFDVAWGRARA